MYYCPWPEASWQSGTRPLTLTRRRAILHVSTKGERPQHTMNYVSISNFTIGSGFGKGRTFTVGSKVTEKFFRQLPDSLKKRFVETNSKKRELYTEEEKLMIIELYLNQFDASGTVDYEVAFEQFHAVFPDRSFNSMKKLMYAIQSRDTLCPQIGLTSVANDVAEALNAYDADRFPIAVDRTAKVDKLLDNLLADIRG